MNWEFESLTACPLCAAPRAVNVFRERRRGVPLSFVKCVGCSLVYQNPRPTRECLRAYFASTTFFRDGANEDGNLKEPLGYFNYDNWDISYRRTAKLRLARIARHVAPPSKLLEVGPATGTFLSAAKRAGYDVRGLEVSGTLAGVARSRGLTVDEGFIESAQLPTAEHDVVCSFGAITCWFDPLRGLANVRKTLRRGGVFVFNHMNVDNVVYRAQGNRNWDYQHACLTLWSRSTMLLALRRAGFHVLFEQCERQMVTLGRLAEYLRSAAMLAATRKLGVQELALPLVVPFTRLVICRPAELPDVSGAGHLLAASSNPSVPAAIA